MLVDTQPATHQHLPASPEVIDQWVNAQLIGVLMDNMVPSMLAATMALPVLVFMMAGEVDLPSLLLWTGLLVTVLVFRYRLIGIYQLRYDSSEGPQRMAFVNRYQWTWSAVGFLWGGGVLLTYLQARPATQFVCGIVVLGQGLLTLTAFSAYLPVFRRYVHALVISVLLGLTLNTFRAPDTTSVMEQSLALMALLMVFWWLLLVAGKRLHQICLLYTSPSPRDKRQYRMPSSA